MKGEGEQQGASVWRFARASRAHVVIDAAGYFNLLHEAMLAARERIMLLGWDFDTRVRLGSGRRWWNLPRRAQYPERLGGLVVWLVRRRRTLRVLVLRWSFGAAKVLLRGSMVLDLLRWAWNRRIFFRLDSALPMGCSHHEKVVVIDDSLAACGGIDITFARWDTSDHLDDNPHRRRPAAGRRAMGRGARQSRGMRPRRGWPVCAHAKYAQSRPQGRAPPAGRSSTGVPSAPGQKVSVKSRNLSMDMYDVSHKSKNLSQSQKHGI